MSSASRRRRADNRPVEETATHNSVLLTEQCDNYCLMCSQPPKDRDDAWLFDRAKQIVSLLPSSARSLGLTGGEPTLHADALIDLLEHCRDTTPWLQLHLLSNGRRFADAEFASRYAQVGLADIMVGIPVYAPEPGLHDFIVQASGAFDETDPRHPESRFLGAMRRDPHRRPVAHRAGARRPSALYRAQPSVR